MNSLSKTREDNSPLDVSKMVMVLCVCVWREEVYELNVMLKKYSIKHTICPPLLPLKHFTQLRFSLYLPQLAEGING